MLMFAWLASGDFLHTITLFDVTLQPALVALLFGCMVLAATCLAPDAPPIGTGAWRPLSRLSYSLYLVHFPLIPPSLSVSAALHAPAIVFWPVYLAISLFAAIALHFLVEKPFLLLKDRKLQPAHTQPVRSS